MNKIFRLKGQLTVLRIQISLYFEKKKESQKQSAQSFSKKGIFTSYGMGSQKSVLSFRNRTIITRLGKIKDKH